MTRVTMKHYNKDEMFELVKNILDRNYPDIHFRSDGAYVVSEDGSIVLNVYDDLETMNDRLCHYSDEYDFNYLEEYVLELAKESLELFKSNK